MTYNDAVEEDIALSGELAQDLDMGFGSFTISKKERKKRPQVVERIRFYDMAYKVPHLSQFKEIYKIRPNKSSTENYTAVFFGSRPALRVG